MTENEVLDALREIMKPLNKKMEDMQIKLDDMDLKLDSSRLENKIEHRAIRKDFDNLNDEMETVIAVLQAKNILPKAL